MKRIVFLVSLLLAAFSIQAQVQNPTTWSFSQTQTGDGEYELTFKASIQDGWTIYSMYTPEGGPSQTELTIEGKGMELVGKAVEKEPIKKYDDVFKVDVWYFSKEYTVSQKIKVADPSETIHANISYQVCQEGQCVLFEENFTISLSDSAKVSEAGKAEDDSLWMFFWVAFGFGLLAIVTPCVFPMIPMTVSFFMHGDSNKAKARSKALFFSLSIVCIYTVLGLIISFLLGPGFTNWLSTHWLPNILFFIIFMIFAASFFGAFEIVLPSRFVNKSDKQADKGGYLGAFFMAFTLVLVSFSCTAPIVGTVLVEAATGSVLRPVVGMLGFSIAMALPFGFFAFFPSKLASLPKSGGWLNSVKVVLGFIELALGLKFLMVADQTYHWGLLDREIYIAIWIAIFILMGLYLLGKIKFKHDSDMKYLGIGRLFLAIVTFTFVIYLIPGMFGAPLKGFAGYLPPQETIDFDINRIVRDNARDIMKSGVAVGTPGKAVASTQCEDAKYSDFLHLPQGLEGYFDYEQGLKCAKAQNKPIFIDFTGHGCVNCREMEQSVWSDPRILSMLRNEYVIIALYVDDKTRLPESEWITGYDGRVKKDLGRKNADFQMRYFKNNAQPNYILLDSRIEGTDFENYQLMPARAYNLDKDGFYNFLKQGLENFRKK